MAEQKRHCASRKRRGAVQRGQLTSRSLSVFHCLSFHVSVYIFFHKRISHSHTSGTNFRKGYQSILLKIAAQKLHSMKKRQRKQLESVVREVRQQSYIQEVKLLIYISTSHPRTQLHRAKQTSWADISPFLILSLKGRNTITPLCHTVQCISFCTFLPEKRRSVVLGHMAS